MCTAKPTVGRILSVFCCIFCCFTAVAQNRAPRESAFGSYHSFKGAGLSYNSFTNSNNDRYSAILDLSGIILGVSSTPGFKVAYCHEMNFAEVRFKSGRVCNFFAGPGFVGGYVRDEDPILGAMAGISGSLGARMCFGDRFRIALSFQSELALHVYNDYITDVLTMSLYKSGLRNVYLPQLNIDYCF